MKKHLLLLLLSVYAFGQNPNPFPNGLKTTKIDTYASGILPINGGVTINSTTHGLIPPNVTTAQKNLFVTPQISETVFDTDLGKYQYWNGTAWVDFGGGGGDFIPLSGTEVLSPVTGDIEVEGTGDEFPVVHKIYTKNDYEKAGVYFQNDGVSAESGIYNIADDGVNYFESTLHSSPISFQLKSSKPTFQGLIGDSDYSANYESQPNAYIQNQYMKDYVAAHSGGGGAVDSVNGQTGVVVLDAGDVGAIPLSGTTAGNPVTGNIEITDGTNTLFIQPNLIQANTDLAVDGIAVLGLNDDSGALAFLRLENTAGDVSSYLEINNSLGGRSALNGSGELRLASNTGGTVTINADDVSTAYTAKIPNKTGTQTFAMLSDVGGGATNLSYTASTTDGTVNSDTGTDATLPLADGTNAGLLAPADFTKLGNQSGTNTGDNSVNTNSNAYSDAKVQNNLTASTTIAPSATAVNTALALKQDNPNVILDLTDYPTTATLTTLHVVSSHVIPANTLSNNSILKYMTSFDRTGTAGTSSMGIYLDTSAGTIGSAVSGTAVLIAACTMATTGRLPNVERTFKLASNLLTGYPAGVNSPTDAVAVTSALTATPLTPATTYYLITGIINNSAADIVTQRMTSLTQIK